MSDPISESDSPSISTSGVLNWPLEKFYEDVYCGKCGYFVNIEATDNSIFTIGGFIDTVRKHIVECKGTKQ